MMIEFLCKHLSRPYILAQPCNSFSLIKPAVLQPNAPPKKKYVSPTHADLFLKRVLSRR